MANENGGTEQDGFHAEQRRWGMFEVPVIQPIENTDPETIAVENMFCKATLSADFLFDSSEAKPNHIPQLDFYFGDDTLLAEKNQSLDGSIPAKFFAMELSGLSSRLLTWNEEKGEVVSDKVTEMIKGAKKVAIIDAHGDTYGDKGDEFWALSGSGDSAYGADRVMKSLVGKDYDLVVLFACNPDDLSLGLEKSGEKRPAIIRFTLDNSFDIPEDVEQPVKFIPAIN